MWYGVGLLLCYLQAKQVYTAFPGVTQQTQQHGMDSRATLRMDIEFYVGIEWALLQSFYRIQVLWADQKY